MKFLAPKRLNFKDSVLSPLQIFSVLIYSLLLTKWVTPNLISRSQSYVTVNLRPTRTASSVNFLSPLNLTAGIHEPAIYFLSAVQRSQLLGFPFSTEAGKVIPHLLMWQYSMAAKSRIIRLELLPIVLGSFSFISRPYCSCTQLFLPSKLLHD